MRITILAGLIAAGVCVSYAAEEGSGQVTPVEQAGSVIHLTKDSFSETIKANDIVLVDFWATWCPPCQMQKPILEELANEVDKGVVIAKVDVDKNKALGNEFDISSLPTLIVFKDGKVLDRYTGLQSKMKLSDAIKKAREGSPATF